MASSVSLPSRDHRRGAAERRGSLLADPLRVDRGRFGETRDARSKFLNHGILDFGGHSHSSLRSRSRKHSLAHVHPMFRFVDKRQLASIR